MQFQDVAIVLPCTSLEDFPAQLPSGDAAQLLGAWSLAWHPGLLAMTGRMPSWHPAGAPPELMADTAILLPPVSAAELPSGWLARIEADSPGAVVLREFRPRPWELAEAFAGVRSKTGGGIAGNDGVDRELVRDFFALGFCYLMVELLTRQMRYASNLDSVRLQEFAVEAAVAAVAGKGDASRDALQRAFDTLVSARDYFYPVDSYLIDMTLVAPSLFGKPLRDRLAEPTPTNVLASAAMIERLAEAEPESLEALRAALDRGTACLVGGEYEEHDWRLLPPQASLANLVRGQAVYGRLVGRSPTIYGRRSFQLVPRLPQMLAGLGFESALVATFDGRPLPKPKQTKTKWEGVDGTKIDALWRVPLDSGAAETMVRFAQDAGQAMDRDFVAAIVFAGWPGATSPWYDDLRRAATFNSALGKFVTLSGFFADSAMTDSTTRPSPDADRAEVAIMRRTTDPFSASVAARQAVADAARGRRLGVISELLSGGSPGQKAVVNPFGHPQSIHVAGSYLPDVPAFGVAWLGDPPPDPPVPLAEPWRLRNEFLQVEVDRVTGAIRGIGGYGRRGPAVAQQIAYLDRGADNGRQSFGSPTYSVMATDSLRVTLANSACGEIEVCGRLLARDGQRIADFRQRTRLPRKSRVVLIEGEIHPATRTLGTSWSLSAATTGTPDAPRSPAALPYFALRFAWPEGDSVLCHSGCATRQPVGTKWIVAGDYVHISQLAGGWTLFPMGLPLHCRTDDRMLDTLIIVDGESQRTFRCAVGVDLSPAILESLADSLFAAAEPAIVTAPRASGANSAWLFHVDHPNVLLVDIARLEGARPGIAAWLMETLGCATRTRLRCFRDVTAARKLTLAGERLGPLEVADGAVVVDVGPYGWVRLEAEWDR